MAEALRSARIALAFFTVLPSGDTGPARSADLARAAAWLPAVGLLIGGLLALASVLSSFLPAGTSAALVLALWLAVTGMLHLDGLLDCADALLAPVGRSRRLEILKDVQVGAFAFGVGVVSLLLKWQCLAALPGLAPLVVAPTVARAVVLRNLVHYPTARSDGLGVAAAGRPSSPEDPRSSGWWSPGVVLALGLSVLAPAAALGTLLSGLWISRWAVARLGGGITGDVHGATIELAELGGLLAAVAWAVWPTGLGSV